MADLAALLKARMVDVAAHDAATSDLNLLRKPTERQAEAGNYRKGHTSVGGLAIATRTFDSRGAETGAIPGNVQCKRCRMHAQGLANSSVRGLRAIRA